MRKVIGRTILTLFLMLASFIAGRTWSSPEAPDSSGELDLTTGLLGKPRVDWNVQDMPLEGFIAQLQTKYGVPVAANWKALESVGVDRETRVTLIANQVELTQIPWLLRNAEHTRLLYVEFLWRGNLLLLTIADEAIPDQVTRIYDIRKLHRLMYGTELPEIVYVTNTPSSATQIPPAASTQSTGRGLFSGTPESSPEREIALEQLMDQLMDSVTLSNWRENGGPIGSIREYGGYLVIKQTPMAHFQIRRRLNWMAMHPHEAAIWRAPTTQAMDRP